MRDACVSHDDGAHMVHSVDNLEDISQLESYITETQCVIIFLSKGCNPSAVGTHDPRPCDRALCRDTPDFFSANCKRELRQSIGEDKPHAQGLEHSTRRSAHPLPPTGVRPPTVQALLGA